MKNYLVALYGLLVLVGGIIGYVKAGSPPSLIAGSAFGLALLACAYFNPSWIWPFILAAILAFFFGYRFTISHAFMPAGLMTTLSIIMMVYLLVKRGS